MSDSDDTDVLLMIPPDLFLIPSSDSEDNLDSCSWQQRKTGLVSELIDHMQTLESRISVIESKDSPNSSLNLGRRMSLDSIMSCRQTSSKNKYSVSQNSSLQTSPSKPYSFSLPSTPNIHQKLNHTNENYHCPNFNGTHQIHKRDLGYLKKHDHSNSLSELLHSQRALQPTSALHSGIQSSGKDLRLLSSSALNMSQNNTLHHAYASLPTGSYTSDLKSIKDMNISEVNKLLREAQSNHNNKVSRNQHPDGNLLKIDKCALAEKKTFDMENSNNGRNKRTDQEQEPITNNHNTCYQSINSSSCGKKRDFNCSLPDSSFSSLNTERFMTEFKSWHPNYSQDADYNKISNISLRNFEDSEKLINGKQEESSKRKNRSIEKNCSSTMIDSHHKENGQENNDHCTSKNVAPTHSNELPKPEAHYVSSNFALLGPLSETTEIARSILNDGDYLQKHSISNLNEMEGSTQRLLTLSDIWSQDSSKPEKERLQMKLDEEKFKREHCEQLIQELQKKLLEYQEKIAVAIRVDNEKNAFISQFQESWKRMQQKLYELETDRESLQKVLKEISEKHQLQIVEYQKQIVNYKEELTKTRNLICGYKEKNDAFVQEKVELLKNHTDELQNYKTLVQQAESRYEEMKIECQKLMEKNKKVDETMKNVQKDLNAELMKSSEIKTELSVIHKALDACEAEMVILRQEKENLQLKLKEETNRNVILEQGKDLAVTALDEAKKLERFAMNEVKSLTEQQEKLRAELRDVYQKQVDQVVKTKLAEFQTQLDSAEAVFQNEVETKQRAIAECAARKIKSVMDKHQLEIHLVEEKHKEEKKLFEIKLAQAVQKSNVLEAQLNSYRKSKSQLVEQLYSMLQKQWHQALVIISGGNGENMSSFQKISVDKLFDFSNEENLASVPEHLSRLCTDPIKSGEQKNMNVKSLQAQDIQNDSLVTLTSNDDTPLSSRKESKSDLRKYIKMILDMQQKDDYQKSKVVNDNAASSQKEEVRKQSLGKNSAANEGNWKWQPISEVSIHDTSEYLSPPQKFTLKSDDSKEKPPWK